MSLAIEVNMVFPRDREVVRSGWFPINSILSNVWGNCIFMKRVPCQLLGSGLGNQNDHLGTESEDS